MDRLFTICYLPTCLVTLGLTMNRNSHAARRMRILSSFFAFFVIMLLVPLVSPRFISPAPHPCRTRQLGCYARLT